MMKSLLYRSGQTTLAMWGVLLAVAFVALIVWYLFTPTLLTVAVVKGTDERIVGALAEITNPRRSLTIRTQEYPDFRQASEALEKGAVNIATVQSDIHFPRNGATVAVLREEHLIIAASAKIEELPKLAGKRIAIVSRQRSDVEVIEQVLAHYKLNAPTTTVAPVSGEQLRSAGRVDAVIFMAAPSAAYVSKLLDTVAKLLGNDFKILELQGVDAFVTASPGLSQATLQAGSLRGRPLLPKEEIKTFSTSSRLVASTDLDRSIVAKLTEQLFQRRQWIARTVPEANFIQAPEDDKSLSARLPNHRGAIDYFNREQQTFMDQYGDWLWLSLFAAGGASSLFGWAMQNLAKQRREAIDDVLNQLLRILSKARESKSMDELMKLTLDADQLIATAVKQTRRKTTSTATMSAIMLSVDAVRHSIEDRRRQLTEVAVPKAKAGDRRALSA